ncbi:MAG: exodeoxyribonuclease VII large subunit [Woeseia sp.]
MDDRFAKGGAAGALTVSELNRQARQLLERGFATVQVEGELSNLARPASGHLYFTLKDSSAQIRCAYFRQRQRGPTIRLADGDQVLATGRVSIYEARGDYQLIVEQLEPAGEGELRRRFEALKKKLAAEGLFDEAIKQPLPALPRCIGVITSPAGAAIRDILSILKRRFPAIPVIIYPSAVQGAAAIPELLAALDSAVRRDECDVLIIGRGGGSLEDLWAFNDEGLARALHACPIPVVSAVGHEVDFTIADFVADLRAPTPSGAAEQVVPDQAAWQRSLQALAERLNAHIGRRLEARQQQLDWLAKRLAQGSPAATVARQSERLAHLRLRLAAGMRHGLTTRWQHSERLQARLWRQTPAARVERARYRCTALAVQLGRAAGRRIEMLEHRLAVAARALHSVSPLATLERGYAIVSTGEGGRVLRDAAMVKPGDDVRARLSRGTILATVTGLEPGTTTSDPGSDDA